MGLSLRGTTSGAIDINPPAVAGDNAITLPASNGSANQFFKNSGTAGIVTYSSMVETSGGSVGIGTITPDTILSLHGTLGTEKLITLSTGPAKRNNYIGVESSDNLAIGADEDNEGNDSSIRFRVDGSERVRITSDGEVGIGTDNPSQELSIYGTGAVRSEIVCTNYNDAGAGIYLRTMNGGSTVSNATLNTNTTGDLLFWTGTSGASERLRISSAGAFGIAGANYGNAGQVIKSNGSSAAPTWQNLYSYFFYGEQDTQTNIATNTYISLKNLGERGVAIGDASIASWNESEGELTVGSSGAGYWFLSCAAGIDDIQSADFIQVVISKNGTDSALGTNVSTYGRSWNGVTANQVVVDNTSCIAELAANDVVRFYVYHNEGSTEPTEPNRTFAMGYRIGGTSG
tara:strand:- start:800 stop:2005 length:1206 start_codon:yes stop_codon:yes gene_type:complete